MPTRGAPPPGPPAEPTVAEGDATHCVVNCDLSWLHVEGLSLLNEQGETVELRGVNLGGWLTWEGWIWGGGFNAESTILERLASVAGQERTEQFRQEVYGRFITEADIARIHELGFNVVRVPINHRLLEEENEAGRQLLDRLLAWCERHQLYVVLTLHAAPGGQAKLFTADPDAGDLLWESAENQASTVAFWQTIATWYADRPVVAGYDLLNEPDPAAPEMLLALYEEIIAAIRTVDQRHIIILEGSSLGRDLTLFAEPPATNLVYSFHMYTWFGDPREEELARHAAKALQHNTPLWVGEFGENNLDMLAGTVALYENSELPIVGWAFWTWKKVPNRYPYLMAIQPGPAWQQLIEWVEWPRWPNVAPTPDIVEQGMTEFLEAVQVDQLTFNADMAEALLQP
jgi:hypothetical protein